MEIKTISGDVEVLDEILDKLNDKTYDEIIRNDFYFIAFCGIIN